MNRIEEINRIIDFHLCNNLILDERFINNIAYCCLEIMGLVDEIKIVRVGKIYDGFSMGYYNINKREIVLDVDKIMNKAYQYLNQNPSLYYIRCANFINYNILHCLFHELRHVWQVNCLLKENNNASKIINYTDDIRKRDFSFYMKKHDLFPLEKDANVFSHSVTLERFMDADPMVVNDHEIRFIVDSFLRFMIRNYNPTVFLDNPLKDIVLSPKAYKTKESLEFIKYSLMKTSIECSNQDLFERLSFNFPINKAEYEYMQKTIDYYNNNQMPRNVNVKKLILGGK